MCPVLSGSHNKSKTPVCYDATRTTGTSPVVGCLNMIEHMQARLLMGAKRLLGCAAARRLIRQQDGAAAIEFGLVAAPFLALLFAIMETAIVFFAGQALETAAADSARLIMTGQ